MPILGSLAGASIQAYGSRGLVPTGSALYNSVYDSLNVPAGTSFQYGTGDFTVEMWFYPTSISAYGSTLFRQRGTNYYTQRYLFLWIHPNRQIFLQVAGNDYFVGTANTCDLNAWNHVALVRRSGSIQIFLNGYANTPRANTTNFSDTSSYPPMFGSIGFDLNYAFSGNLTNIRIAKSAYYITSFIPDRTPFTRTSQGATNVQLLLNFKNAAGLLVDSSANNITVTNSTINLVTYSTLTPFSGAFVTPPVVNAATATVTPSTLSVDEGDTISFTVATTNVPNGTYYWTIELPASTPPAAADFSGSALTGTFTVTSSSGSFNITTVSDRLTEGTETFSVFVRSGSTTGIVLGVTDEITINDISLTPAFIVDPLSTAEGFNYQYTVNNLGPAGTYYWTILNGTTVNADFSAVSGSFTTSTLNGNASFTITPVADYATEGTQTYQVEIRTGGTAGTVIATSSTQSLLDFSTTVTASGSPTAFNEGASTTITASATAFPAGTYYWTILNGTTTNADFTATSGSFVVASNTGNFTVTAATLGGAEAAETFQVEIRTGSTSGTVIATTSALTINANAT